MFIRKIALTAGLFYRQIQRGQFKKNNGLKDLKNYFIKDANQKNKFNKITTKEEIRAREKPKNGKQYVKGRTSGSTGEPLVFYRNKESIELEYDIYDSLYSHSAQEADFITARISGVPISKVTKSKPVGVYLPILKRLQMSAYHINASNVLDYYYLLKKHKPSLGTGYATSWYDLALEFKSARLEYNGFSAIVTDSSGLSYEEQKVVEETFNTRVIQTYGLSEVGMVAVQCENKNYHILNRAECKILTEDNVIKEEGTGEILITDFHSSGFPYVNYATGDLGVIEKNKCKCEFQSDYIITELLGRSDDYILLPNGTKLRGGLTKIFSDLTCIDKSQVIQKKDGRILIILKISNECKNIDEIKKVILDRSSVYFTGLPVEVNSELDFIYTTAGKFKFLYKE